MLSLNKDINHPKSISVENQLNYKKKDFEILDN
jgi:hypothetical protein